jgi:hypothetical protein
LQLLEGAPPVFSIPFASMQVDGATPTSTAPAGTFIGGLSMSETDWTVPWTYGIHADNRAQPLWFE